MTNAVGFIVQCEVCPQKAILAEQPQQPGRGYLCPRCLASGFGDVDVAAAEPISQVRAALTCSGLLDADDDAYMLRQAQG
ncbi:hypothetical protein [Mycobacterium sp. NPDC050041]|uniref:hypothetical protein n=1 Tax=Mycobacterium sp. NPDC050041 TaxID=3364293 RepID=UPI003C2CE025